MVRGVLRRPADEVVGSEALWQVSETAWVVVDEHSERAGHALLTLGVDGLDEILARLVAHGIGHQPVETYDNGVRQVVVLDPDGTSLSLAEAPAGRRALQRPEPAETKALPTDARPDVWERTGRARARQSLSAPPELPRKRAG